MKKIFLAFLLFLPISSSAITVDSAFPYFPAISFDGSTGSGWLGIYSASTDGSMLVNQSFGFPVVSNNVVGPSYGIYTFIEKTNSSACIGLTRTQCEAIAITPPAVAELYDNSGTPAWRVYTPPLPPFSPPMVAGIIVGGITDLGTNMLLIFLGVIILIVAIFVFRRGLKWVKTSSSSDYSGELGLKDGPPQGKDIYSRVMRDDASTYPNQLR